MDIFKLAGLSAITALLSLTVRSIRPEMGLQTALAGGLIILFMAVSELSGITERIRELTASFGLDESIPALILKAAGIAYMTDISAGVCRDAGESALAVKTEICGRLMLLAAAMPMLTDLARILIGLIGETL